MSDDYLLKVSDDLVSLLRNLHPLIKAHIRSALHFLVKNPNIGKLLKEELHGLRSYRVRKYRVIYRIVAPEKILEIIVIGPRNNIYEETFKILKGNPSINV
jgi:mRNA interferase RelE/StbE